MLVISMESLNVIFLSTSFPLNRVSALGSSSTDAASTVSLEKLFLLVFAGMTAIGPAVHAAESEVAGYPVYKPPLRGVPAARVGGGTRGGSDTATEVYVLTPEHMGLTSKPQPVLFWYLSHMVVAKYEFVMIAETDYEPLVEATLTTVKSAGIQRIALADLDVQLQPGVQYQWSVAVVMDQAHRSGDVLSSGMIEYIEPPAGILANAEKASGEVRVAQYAAAGLWYDALLSLDELIRSGRDTSRFRQMRASLLQQVGLNTVAAAVGG